MNYMIMPFFVALIALFQVYLTRSIGRKMIRENNCIIWCITLLFSLLGAIISFHLYRYELPNHFSWGLVPLFALYLVLTAIFILISPSGYRGLLKLKELTHEELLYAEYRFHHSLEMIRRFFLTLLFIVPILYYIYCCFENRLTVVLHLTEAYLIGGLYFVIFCVLFPISVRQTIYWLRQLQRIPSEYEEILLYKEYQHSRYFTKNRRL